MKKIFALLLLANVALLMWGLWHGFHEDRRFSAAQPVAPDRIRPLHERGAVLKPRGPDAPPDNVLAAGDAERVRERCLRIGPFDSTAAATRAGGRLDAHGLVWKPDEERAQGVTHWVYMPVNGGRAAARKLLIANARKGVTDQVVMEKTPGRFVVSLGLYSHADNAETRMKDLARKAVRATLERRAEGGGRVWIDARGRLTGQSVNLLRNLPWGEGTGGESAGGEGISLRVQACP